MTKATQAAMSALLLASTLLLLAGCTPDQDPAQAAWSAVRARAATVPARSSPSETSIALKPVAPGPPKPGNQASDFRLHDQQGNSVTLSQFRGKGVMINFWASWCGPCRYEIPHMVRVYDEYRDTGLEILAINLQESQETAARFAEQLNMRFPVLLDSRAEVASSYFVRAIPTSIFVDAEGIIRYVHVGTLSEAALRTYVQDVIAGGQKR